MYIQKNIAIAFKLALVLIITIVLTACGGGSGGSANPDGTDSGVGGDVGGDVVGGDLLAQEAPTYDRSSAYFVVDSSIDIEISAVQNGATFHYTNNGATPACNSGTEYSAPHIVTISDTTTLKAISCKSGYEDSATVTGTYTAITPTVNVNPASSSKPIADALAIAVDGDIVNVPAGIYTEDLAGFAITNRIIFIGAGSGDDPDPEHPEQRLQVGRRGGVPDH